MKKTIVLCVAALLFFGGCAMFQKQQEVNTQPAAPLNQMFYSFSDVPVPRELEYVQDRSFVYETTGFKAGVLIFTGNIELQSLEVYFKANMARNGWTLVNTFRHGNILMNFVKGDRTCNIKMARASFNTEVEIWVGPGSREGMRQISPSSPASQPIPPAK